MKQIINNGVVYIFLCFVMFLGGLLARATYLLLQTQIGTRLIWTIEAGIAGIAIALVGWRFIPSIFKIGVKNLPESLSPGQRLKTTIGFFFDGLWRISNIFIVFESY